MELPLKIKKRSRGGKTNQETWKAERWLLTRRNMRRLGVLYFDLDDGYTGVHICKNSSCCILKNMCTWLHVLYLNKISEENDDVL